MKIKVYCQACKEYVLDADTELLALPLTGAMFPARSDREWDTFSPHEVAMNLTCPMCTWLFHVEQKIMIGSPNAELQTVDEILGFLRQQEAEERASQSATAIIARHTMENSNVSQDIPKTKKSKKRKKNNPALEKMGLEG